MRVMIEVHHPAHIHFWKYVIRKLQDSGDTVVVLGRQRSVMEALLMEYFWIEYKLPKQSNWSTLHPISQFLSRQRFVAKSIASFRPDVVASLMGSYCQSAKLHRVRNVIFTDSEFQKLNHRIAHPFADEIHTPACLSANFGRKHRRYNGFHELAYLREGTFEEDPHLKLQKYDPNGRGYVVMRLCAWDAYHDVGNHGLTKEDLLKIVKKLKARWEIWIQPEGGKLPEELEAYRLDAKPHLFHSIIKNAKLVVSEGFTTASEALALGVPSVVINQITCDILNYQSSHYKILNHFSRSSEATQWIIDFCDQNIYVDQEKIAAEYQQDHCNVVDYVCRVLTGAN